jgi:hypothetical protein
LAIFSLPHRQAREGSGEIFRAIYCSVMDSLVKLIRTVVKRELIDLARAGRGQGD